MRVKWNRRLDGGVVPQCPEVEQPQEFIVNSNAEDVPVVIKSATLSSCPPPKSSGSSAGGFFSIFGLRKHGGRRSEADSQSTCSVVSNLTEISTTANFERRVSLPTRLKRRPRPDDIENDLTNSSGGGASAYNRQPDDSRSELEFQVVPETSVESSRRGKSKSSSLLRKTERPSKTIFSSFRSKKNHCVEYPDRKVNDLEGAQLSGNFRVPDRKQENVPSVVFRDDLDGGTEVKQTSPTITKSFSLTECQPTGTDNRRSFASFSHSIKSLGPVADGEAPSGKANLFSSARSFFSRSRSYSKKGFYADESSSSFLRRSYSVSDGRVLKQKVGENSLNSSEYGLGSSTSSSRVHIPTETEESLGQQPETLVVVKASKKKSSKVNGFFSALKFGSKSSESAGQSESSKKSRRKDAKQVKSKIP